MFSKLSKRIRKNDGFTLIELIVVVAILGILAAVLTPKVLDALENARANGAQASAKQIQLAFERMLIEDGHYPAEVAGFGPDDLQAWLDDYVSLGDPINGARYAGLDAAGNNNVADGVNPASYILEVQFRGSDRIVQITPTNTRVIPAYTFVDAQ